MKYPLYRAREIIHKRGKLAPWDTTDRARSVNDYIRQWDAHCDERAKAPYVTESYTRIYNRFLDYQQGWLDNPDAPTLGTPIQDKLYLTALQTRLRGQFTPVTYQSPVALDPVWYDVCYDYLCADLLHRGDEESFTQLTTVLNDVFNYENAAIFPKTCVHAFALLIENMSAYNEKVYQIDEPPFHKSLRIFLRTLRAAVYG